MQIEKKFYNERHQPYYICAPGYTRVSNGVRAMHLLCHYLNKLGEEAYVFSPETDPKLRTPYLTQDIVDRHKASGRSPIVVYPEVVHGNPLNGKAVARYILNHPGLLGGPKDYDPSDLLVFWHQDYVDYAKYPDPSFIFIPSIDTAIFNNDDNPHDDSRHRVLVYPGRYKHAERDFPALFQNTDVITYEWPQSHEELAALLRQGKVLYTFANSAIISEALLCGCPVVVMETVFSKKPEERAGLALGLALPGVTFEDTPQAIAAAHGKVVDYQQVYHQYQLELLQQLEGFIAASQKMPQGGPNEIVFPSLKPAQASPEQARYDAWIARNELRPWQAEIHAERMVRSWGSQPRFIVLMPLTADRQQEALKSIGSMGQQLYKHWQLIFIADFDWPHAAFQGSDVLGWLRIDDARDPSQLTQAFAAVIGALPCDWITVLPAGAELAVNALLSLGDHASLHPEWQAIYSDCDELGADGKRCRPVFKPDFNLDLQRGADYISPSVWFRREALQETGAFAEAPAADGCDALWRLHDAYGGRVIGHIADMLVHLPAAAAEPADAAAARERALAAHLERQGGAAVIQPGAAVGSFHIRYLAAGQCKVSVIIADAGDGVSLSSSIDAVLAADWEQVCEILAVTPAAAELPAAARRVACASELSLAGRYQLGAEAASGDYLLFLDSRVEVGRSDWLPDLLGLASRQGVGAAAPRLLRADGKTVWRGPLLLGADAGAASVFDGADAAAPGDLGRQLIEHNPGAVPLDCLLMSRALYEEIGGLDASLEDADSAAVDLCLKIRAADKLLVWTPFVSALRQPDAAPLAARLDEEALSRRWYGWLRHDAAYNRHLSLDSRQAFQVENVYSAEWDPDFYERARVLMLPGTSPAGAARLRAPLLRLMDDGKLLATMLPAGQRLPSAGELERLAPDVLVQAARFEPGFLDWLRLSRRSRPDMLSILVLDDLDAGGAVSDRYARTMLRALAREADRIIVPTEALRALAGAFCEDVRLVPEALDEARWEGLISLRGMGKKPRVAWSGTEAEVEDLMLLTGIILATGGEIDWIVFGHCPDALHPYLAEYHPFDLASEDYPRKLASLGIDLAVMPKHADGRREAAGRRRLLEYGALGIPVACSALDDWPGLAQAPVARADNEAAAWSQVLLERARDLERAGREGERLKAWVKENCMLGPHLPSWLEALGR
ncbi:hypothetical protein [Chromobacterium subtsugae]|uniref:hypothetical protein n=1 Tax=Chromobacterium subtsugae TaxID=251747 RepID=UPI0006411274|nr:hypothetical protein [Chromobacterium subtsugae]